LTSTDTDTTSTTYLTTKQIAQRTGWRQEDVNKLIRMKILPAKTSGPRFEPGNWRYEVPEAALERLLRFIEESDYSDG
jgi:hypothetical protein